MLGSALLIPAGATADLRGERCLLRQSVSVRPGGLSFAFCVVQLLVRRAGLRLPDTLTHHTAFAAAVPAAALACAWLLGRGVEAPPDSWI